MNTPFNTQEYKECRTLFLQMWTAVGIARDNGAYMAYSKSDWKALDSAIYAAVEAAGNRSVARAAQGRASGSLLQPGDCRTLFLKMWGAVGMADELGNFFPYVKRDWKDLDSAIDAAVSAAARAAPRGVSSPGVKEGRTAWERLLSD